MHRFNDSRKWGQYSFLDILERNNIAFTYDGKNLSFPNKNSEERASRIWYSLTGMRQIGVHA